MWYRGLLAVTLLGCSSTAASREQEGTAEHAVAPAVHEPAGAEFFSLSRGELRLAPGREGWLHVSTFIKVSPHSMEAVTPRTRWTSSNPAVAMVEPASDTTGYARVVARAAGIAVITAQSLRDRANVGRTTVEVRSAPPANDTGLVYSASSSLRITSPQLLNAPLGPMRLHVTATIENPTPAPKEVWLSGCAVWTRVHPSGARPAPLAEAIPRGVQCMAPDSKLTLAPGERKSFAAEGFNVRQPGDSVPAGRYHVEAVFDRINDLLAVPAGFVDVVDPNAGVRFAASTKQLGSNLATRVTMTNENAVGVRLEFGACAVELLAYRSAERVGKPVWSSDYRRPADGGVYGCPAYMALSVVNPGETVSPKELNPQFPVAEFLGDSLPPGRYHFAARVRMNGRFVHVPAGDLAVSRP